MTSPIFDQARKRGAEDKVGQLNPMGRYGVAEGASRLRPTVSCYQYLYPLTVEIANAVLFLSSGMLIISTFNAVLMT